MITTLPLRFEARTRAEAEALAHAWAAKEPKIAAIRVLTCDPTKYPLRAEYAFEVGWHVTLDIEWKAAPEQADLGL